MNNIEEQEEKQKYTFWQFIKRGKIEIPIIQRDYAQGRIGKEDLRNKFLLDLENALDKKEKLELDFVYGKVESESNTLIPLDGQQRLTTLWLLHWYIAYKAGKIKEKNIQEIFQKFSYETRISSKEFCKQLSQFTEEEPQSYNIAKRIQNQTWFYSEWKQDPTIQSMLRMLSGTPNKNLKGDEIVDGLEELFACKTQEDMQKYWDYIISEGCPITFYFLNMKELKQTDDVYIKMNARGEQLTNFENFKADLIGYITEQSINEKSTDKEKEDWKSLLDPKAGIPIKMDTKWTDIFWKNKSETFKIDDIYFAFFNRYFFNALITQKKDGNYMFNQNDFDKSGSNKFFDYLYGRYQEEKEDDRKISYSSFEKYKYNNIDIDVFKSLDNTLTNYFNFINNHSIFKDETLWHSFSFIPKYDDKEKIQNFAGEEILSFESITQLQRVVFFAICKFFEIANNEEKNIETNFKHWLRVVWNIVENANINGISQMIGCMRLIDILCKHSHDIYSYLADKNTIIESDFAKEQVNEEIEKIKQIKEGGEEWETQIIEAENYAFFHGAIRFLFRNENGDINWSNFDTKWEKAQKYFDANGIKGDYKKDSILLRQLICCFTKWRQLWLIVYDNTANSWRDILLNNELKSPVNSILLGSFCDLTEGSKIIDFEKGYEPLQKQSHEDLYQTTLLSNVEKGTILHWRQDWNKSYAIYYSNCKRSQCIFFIGNKRNMLLKDFESVQKIDCGKGKVFFGGGEVNFKYSQKDFQWNRYEYVYLQDKTDNKIKKDNPNPQTEEDEYYCFKVEEIENETNFQGKLDKLIEQAKAENKLD